MKTVVIAALLACAAGVFADAPQPRAEGAPEGRRQMRAEGSRVRLTPEQRKERRERFMKQMMARQEELQGKVVAVLQEAGLDAAKAKSVAEKIQQIYHEGLPHRPFPPDGPRRRPEAK